MAEYNETKKTDAWTIIQMLQNPGLQTVTEPYTLNALRAMLHGLKNSPMEWKDYICKAFQSVQHVYRTCFQDEFLTLKTMKMCETVFKAIEKFVETCPEYQDFDDDYSESLQRTCRTNPILNFDFLDPQEKVGANESSTNDADCENNREIDQGRIGVLSERPACTPSAPGLKPWRRSRINEIVFKSGVVNQPAQKLLSINMYGEQYIDIDHVWGVNSRWLSLKYKLLQKGIIKLQEFYTCYPIYREEFILSRGKYGAVEIGFALNFRAIAIRRLTENGWSPEKCEHLQKVIRKMQNLKHVNLLESFVVEDCCGHFFFYSSLCDYNLVEYLSKMNETQQLNWNVMKRMCNQMVNGLEVLHKNSIVHGNLKPSNIFVDDLGIVKVAEFGIAQPMDFPNDVIPPETKIWWSTETVILYNWSKIYLCSTMSDIQVCGFLIFYITSGGMHPFGSTNEEIIKNVENGEPVGLAVPVYCELQSLLKKMLNPIYLQRPTIVEVMNHVYFWNEDKKWEFTKVCLKLSNTEYENYSSKEFCIAIRQFLENEPISFFWVTSACVHFPNVEIPWNHWSDPALGLLKYLNKCRLEDPILFNRPGYVLEAFPQIPCLLYDALVHTHWFQHPELIIFDPHNRNF